MAIFWIGDFCLLVEFHREGSESEACQQACFKRASIGKTAQLVINDVFKIFSNNFFNLSLNKKCQKIAKKYKKSARSCSTVTKSANRCQKVTTVAKSSKKDQQVPKIQKKNMGEKRLTIFSCYFSFFASNPTHFWHFFCLSMKNKLFTGKNLHYMVFQNPGGGLHTCKKWIQRFLQNPTFFSFSVKLWAFHVQIKNDMAFCYKGAGACVK